MGYEIVRGDTHGLSDVSKFLETLSTLVDHAELTIARAPGRLDVMGGIADYSGSLVLELPIAEATLAGVQKSGDRRLAIRSLARARYEDLHFDIQLSDLKADYKKIREMFSVKRSTHWAAYVAGIFPVLARECGLEFQTGARILISSDVPPGKGVSSSAALEVATMQAVCAAFGIVIEPRRLAVLCQMVENLIVGAPCGVMDQFTSHCGVENSLISLLCQPAEIKGSVEIPPGIKFWGIDSGVRHAVTGSDYSSVRTGAFMGYRIIAELAGLNVRKSGDGLVEFDDKRWHGCLANLSPGEYQSEFAHAIP